MGRFYLAAVQSILLYGSESWTLTDQQLCLLNSFHHHCACHITHMHIRPLPDGTWVTPASTDVLQAAGLKLISTYIQKRQEHVTEFAKNLPIYAQCDASKPTKNTLAHMYWWLLPNDVLNPPATPMITNMTHSTNHLRTCPPHSTFYHYHYRNTPRPTTVLLNNPEHPMHHTMYYHNAPTITHPTNMGPPPYITLDTTTTNAPTPNTATTTNPSSLSHASTIHTHYDHDHSSYTSTNLDMTWQ